MLKNSENRGISVVIPAYNEEKNVKLLYNKLKGVLDGLERDYEIIFVDDGSTDNTFRTLKEMHRGDSNLKVIRLRRNFGQSAALAAGFDHSEGDVVITMDADLQNDPEDIPALLENLEAGNDVVCGWRFNRKDPFLLKKMPSKFSNWLASRLTGLKLNDFGCTLKAFRREVIEDINLYGELHRYIPAMISWKGVSIAEMKVNHSPRLYGSTKYGASRLVRGFLDLITVKFLLSYSTKPLQFFGIPGMAAIVVGFVIGAYLSVIRLIFGVSIGDRPLLLLVVLLIFLGVQFISIGLLGEIIGRTYHEVQKNPVYAVKEIVGEERTYAD